MERDYPNTCRFFNPKWALEILNNRVVCVADHRDVLAILDGIVLTEIDEI